MLPTQKTLVLNNPAALSDPFYLMFPDVIRFPAVLLATVATVIASQSVITGAFSLARQAIHLGFLPRMEIYHTSESNTGQIYLPAVNTILLFGVMALVLMFRSSEALAVAYGIAAGEILGTFSGRGPVAADATNRRVYFVAAATTTATVSAYDMDKFLPRGSETVPSSIPTSAAR